MLEETFYVATGGGGQRGPVSLAAVREDVLTGRVGPGVKVYSRPQHAGAGWRAASEHPGLADLFDAPPPPPD